MTPRKWAWTAAGLGVLIVVVAVLFGIRPGMQATSAATEAVAVPAPDLDEPVPPVAASETAVLAGGCFWGVQGVFQHVKGVISAESGYDGGARGTANYDTVSTGATGHAESVRVTYDPTRVTYGQILRIFFAVAHDPTELNRQGPDDGTQYRSVIFAQNGTQQRIAQSYVAQLNREEVFSTPVVTSVTSGTEFFPAERYHQDFLNSNPTNPYIEINDLPKVSRLKSDFPALYRDDPVLMLAQDR